MEALLMRHRSLDQSPIHQNPKYIQFNPFISVPPQNYLPSYSQSAGGILQPPPPPYSLHLPPLLPLPASAVSLRRSGSSRPGFSSPKRTNKNNNKNPSFTPTKLSSKSPSKIPKKVEKKTVILPEKSPENATVSLPNPCNNLGFAHYEEMRDDESDHLDMFSGSVAFTISPPPSSLPLPTFSLRPKLSCKIEVVGVDTGATDDLRRLLRLQN